MVPVFDFTDMPLLRESEEPVTIIQENSENPGGQWVDGRFQRDANPSIIKTKAVILPYSDDSLQISNSDASGASGTGGNYTSEDRRMYIHLGAAGGNGTGMGEDPDGEPVELPQELLQGQEIITDNDGKRYLIEADKNYSGHATGLHRYILVRKGRAGAKALLAGIGQAGGGVQ